MRGAEFKEANSKLLSPREGVYDLPIWRNYGENYVISCWKGTWKERFRFLLTGTVWLHVLGPTHPPLVILTEYPFSEVQSESI